MADKELFQEKFTSYSEIAEELQKMVDVDQEMRKGTNKGKPWNSEIDIKNTKRMKEIIRDFGFPIISKVGNWGMENAWLLIQHADRDIEFQKECLKVMKESLPGEIHLKCIAYLEDRINVSEGRKQKYGTQFRKEGEIDVLAPFEGTEEEVDERRVLMGLNTLEEQDADRKIIIAE